MCWLDSQRLQGVGKTEIKIAVAIITNHAGPEAQIRAMINVQGLFAAGQIAGHGVVLLLSCPVAVAEPRNDCSATPGGRD